MLNIGGVYTRPNAADSVFVRLPCAQAKGGSVVLLVDSEADTSLTKRSRLAKGVQVNERVVKNLRGAFGGVSRTTGAMNIIHLEDRELSFGMHCVRKMRKSAGGRNIGTR